MEHGIWQGRRLLAMEIAAQYELEKEVRRASGRGELRCPDPECGSPVIKYCHGEIRGAYFAHRTQEDCDYALFDKRDSGVMRGIRQKLYEHLKRQGVPVELEVKALPHHYVPLLITEEKGRKTVIEVGSQQTTIRQLEKLQLACVQADVRLRWLVADETDTLVRENQTYFLKRYLLNESASKSLLVVSWDGSRLTQYRRDEKRYVKNGVSWLPEGYSSTYMESAPLQKLCYENGELSIHGFEERYLSWQEEKQAAFEAEMRQLEEEKERIRERRAWRESVKQIEEKRLHEESAVKQRREDDQSGNAAAGLQEREDIGLQLEQQEVPARDSAGRRFICCEICGKIDTENQFYTYGGRQHINLGICYECKEDEA